MEDINITHKDLLNIVENQRQLIDKYAANPDYWKDLEFFFKESVDLICVATTDCYFKVINPAFTKLLGYSEEELLRNSFIEYIHPDDVSRTYNEVHRLSQGQHSTNFENRYLCKDGNYVFLQWIAKQDDSCNLIYAIGRDVTKNREVLRDLTEGKKTLNEALSLAKLGSWKFNFGTKNLFWSNELYKILDIDKALVEDLYNEYCVRFANDDFLKLFDYGNDLSQGCIDFDFDYNFDLPNDNRKSIHVTGVGVFNRKGQLVSMRGFVQDITQKKIVEEAARAQKYAEAANKAKTDFLASMSHEIRTPLNGIVGFTNLLLETSLDKNQLLYMNSVSESAKILMELINNILDISKIEAGRFELSPVEIDVFEIANQVVDLFRYEVHKKRLLLSLDLDSDIPRALLADPLRLKQVLINLLGNAIKFTSVGSVRLKVSKLTLDDESSVRLKFSVKDTGFGIKQENQRKIFDSYVQEDDSVACLFGGTGLGLSISKQLLGLMGSKLELCSQYNMGSEFFFEVNFSVSDKNKQQSNEILPTAVNEVFEGNVRPDINLLIVEDNEINMMLVKKMIAKMLPLATVYEAKDGNQAIEINKNFPLALILMDVMMPVKDGYETAAEIRKNEKYKDLPIIALTAGILNGERERCIEVGMNDYLSKPIMESELRRVIFKWAKKL